MKKYYYKTKNLLVNSINHFEELENACISK